MINNRSVPKNHKNRQNDDKRQRKAIKMVIKREKVEENGKMKEQLCEKSLKTNKKEFIIAKKLRFKKGLRKSFLKPCSGKWLKGVRLFY